MKDLATLDNENKYLENVNMQLSVDHQKMRLLLEDIIHPEAYGHAVPVEVRKRASEILRGLLA